MFILEVFSKQRNDSKVKTVNIKNAIYQAVWNGTYLLIHIVFRQKLLVYVVLKRTKKRVSTSCFAFSIVFTVYYVLQRYFTHKLYKSTRWIWNNLRSLQQTMTFYGLLLHCWYSNLKQLKRSSHEWRNKTAEFYELKLTNWKSSTGYTPTKIEKVYSRFRIHSAS